jgi:hypothetical protein
MREKNVIDMANRRSEKDKKIKYVKHIAIIYVTLANLVSEQKKVLIDSLRI